MLRLFGVAFDHLENNSVVGLSISIYRGASSIWDQVQFGSAKFHQTQFILIITISYTNNPINKLNILWTKEHTVGIYKLLKLTRFQMA